MIILYIDFPLNTISEYKQLHIDHVLIDMRPATDMMVVQSYRGANINSDHYVVKVKYRQRLSRMKDQRNPKSTKYKTKFLKMDTSVRETYERRIVGILDETRTPSDGAVDSRWVTITTAMTGVAKQTDRKRKDGSTKNVKKSLRKAMSQEQKGCREQPEQIEKKL